MPCVTMIEKGVLHLDQSEFVGMRKEREKIERTEKERKGKRRGTLVFYWFSSVRTARVRRSRSKLDCAPRGRGSLLLWLVLV